MEITSVGGERYRVAARSIAGDTSAVAKFPLDAQGLERQLRLVESAVMSSSANVRRTPSQEEQPARELGQALFEFLFSDDLRVLLTASRQQAAKEGRKLRLRLRIGPAELASLPWEFLYDKDRGDYLCLFTPVVRYSELLDPVRPLAVTPPLRVLGMVARPGGHYPLDVDQEKERLQRALAGLERADQLQLHWVQGQTWSDLERAIEHDSWHIFHFIGHGGFDSTTNEGFLELADGEGGAKRLHASDLSLLLSNYDPLRLVLLNSCDSARSSALHTFPSMASILVRRNIPAVVAMQYEISDAAAIQFAEGFYDAVANLHSVDVAVTTARRRVRLNRRTSLEWATPVLYLRSPDGQIFDMPAALAEQELNHVSPSIRQEDEEHQLEDLRVKGLEALCDARWSEAETIFRHIVDRHPSDVVSAARLQEARRQQRLEALYAQGREAYDAKRWDETIGHFSAWLDAHPPHRDVQHFIERAKRERSLSELRNELVSLHKAQQWKEVISTWDRIQALDPDATDPEGLVSSARSNLTEVERSRWLAQRTRKGAIRAIRTGVELFRLTHGGEVETVSFSPDGTRLATGGKDKIARLWDVAMGTELVGLAHGGEVETVSFSPDGTRLATSSKDKMARLWDVATGTELARLPHRGGVRSGSASAPGLAFRPDGIYLATASDEVTARLWEVATGKEMDRLVRGGGIRALAFSPDGTRLAGWGRGRTVRIWNLSTRDDPAYLAHSGDVRTLAFSPDGTRLATGGKDKMARLWDVATGTELVRLAHGGEIETLAFSPNSALLATGSSDRTARLWELDVATLKQLACLVHDEQVRALAFSPDGTRLVTGSADKTARLWAL